MNLTAQTPAPTTPAVIGLTSTEAEERLAELGPNTLPEPARPLADKVAVQAARPDLALVEIS
ncbi:cation-transporting P-type ATPase, partial [Rhizobium ruizarguesonis]